MTTNYYTVKIFNNKNEKKKLTTGLFRAVSDEQAIKKFDGMAMEEGGNYMALFRSKNKQLISEWENEGKNE